MRRVVSAPIFKRLLAIGAETAESVAIAERTAASELQAGNARQKQFARYLSQTRAAQSAAAENSIAQASPYTIYGAVGVAGLGIAAYFVARQPADSTVAPVVLKPEAPPTPKDLHEIGEFHVMDHMGMDFTQDSLLGNFAVVYFGTVGDKGRKARLLQMAEAVMESDRKSNMHYLIPVFATLNSKEDDVVKLNAMVEDYATSLNRKSILHVRLKALTGEDNHKLHKRAQAYTTLVKGKEGVQNNPAAATKDDSGDLYFVNPEGEFIASYGAEADPKAVAAEWSEIMKAYKLSHPSWHGPKAVKERHA